MLPSRCWSRWGVAASGWLIRHQSSSPTKIAFPRQHEWNRTVSQAERLVGFPSSMMYLQTLMNDEVSAMATHMRKLIGSDHPVLRCLKRLIFHEGQNNLQVRGIFMLLLARAMNPAALDHMNPDTGVTDKQRKLAEILEMILAAQAIHKSVLNLPHGLQHEPDDEVRQDLLQLEYGNKIAILGGDYLLANACTGLADLRNTYIVELISIAIADFTQAEFIGQRDVQGRLVPTDESLSVQSWMQRQNLAYGSLFANSCKSVAMLAHLPQQMESLAFHIGLHVALALQAFTELQPFTDDVGWHSVAAVDVSMAPVLFHLSKDPELLSYIQQFASNLQDVDMKKVHQRVVSEGHGVAMTKELCHSQAVQALHHIDQLDESDAKSLLIKLVSYLSH